ncbi:MAG: type II toxin-antitoxin system Phd/YefM family antitoxin [Mycoplasmatales bacterium]
MEAITVTAARKNLYKLLEQVNEKHEPILITGKNGNGVFVAQEDWDNIEETLYIQSIKGLEESILEGISAGINGCVAESDVEW